MNLLLAASVTMHALPIDEAQREALFLTDKMAYELGLTDEQYELAYEVNLDYLLSINYHGDIYGTWWNRRNADLRYILSDYQYRLYAGLNYFYRPLTWRGGRWYFPIYGRYTNRAYFYRAHPHGYGVYRGGYNRIHGHYNRPINRPMGGHPGRVGGGRPGGPGVGGHPGGPAPGGNRPGGNYNGGGNRPNGNFNGGGNNGGNRPGGNYNGGGNNGGSRPGGNYNGGGNNGGSRPSGNVRSNQPRSNGGGRVSTPGRRR